MGHPAVVTEDWTERPPVIRDFHPLGKVSSESDGVVTLLRTYQSWYVGVKNPHEGLRKPTT
jgi:hypothetical protein